MNAIDTTAARINWTALTVSEIRALANEAGQYGDTDLVRKARRALRRRGTDL